MDDDHTDALFAALAHRDRRRMLDLLLLLMVQGFMRSGKPASRPCVIYNPTAKGGRALKMRVRLEELGAECTFLATKTAGDATLLAAEAISQGCTQLVAAGGDGTLHEVLNGINSTPGGLQQCSLGVIPLGTINVLAREVGINRLSLAQAWAVIKEGHTRSRRSPHRLPCRRPSLLGRTTAVRARRFHNTS